MVERTDDQPGTGSATYWAAVSLRQASRTLVLAQRSYANNATTSSCMRISPGLEQGSLRSHVAECERSEKVQIPSPVVFATNDVNCRCEPVEVRDLNSDQK